MRKKLGRKKALKFGEKKNNQPTLVALREAERSPRATLSREADYRGFDLGKTGIIKSLLNFIATSQWKPRTKKGKKGLYLRLDETGDFWLENLETECKDPRNAEYYSDWKTNRTYNCERDILQENHPDYEIFGGKASVHKNINSKLDKLGSKADLDEVFQNPEDTEEYWQWIDENLENIDTNKTETGIKYNKELYNKWKSKFTEEINQNKQKLNLIKNNNKNKKLSKKQEEKINDEIYGLEFSINKTTNLLNILNDTVENYLLFSNEYWENFDKKNPELGLYVKRYGSIDRILSERNKMDFNNYYDFIKLIQYDNDLHKGKDKILMDVVF